MADENQRPAESSSSASASPQAQQATLAGGNRIGPNGVILGPDGKPCKVSESQSRRPGQLLVEALTDVLKNKGLQLSQSFRLCIWRRPSEELLLLASWRQGCCVSVSDCDFDLSSGSRCCYPECIPTSTGGRRLQSVSGRLRAARKAHVDLPAFDRGLLSGQAERVAQEARFGTLQQLADPLSLSVLCGRAQERDQDDRPARREQRPRTKRLALQDTQRGQCQAGQEGV